MGLVPRKRGSTELAPQPLLPRDNTTRKKSATWKRALTQPCWHPGLRLPGSRTVKNEFLLLISRPICGISIAAQTSWYSKQQSKLHPEMKTPWFQKRAARQAQWWTSYNFFLAKAPKFLSKIYQYDVTNRIQDLQRSERQSQSPSPHPRRQIKLLSCAVVY